MKWRSIFSFMVCAALPPWGIQTAEAQTAPIFEHVFDGLFNYPTFFYDVNGDGKQEYFLVHHNSDKSPQWCSLSGEMVMAMPNDVGVSPFNWSMLQLNAEPWPAFTSFQHNSYDHFGDLAIFRNESTYKKCLREE